MRRQDDDHSENWTFMNCLHCVMSICLFTEVKRQWATLALGWVTASVSLMALRLC